MDLRGVETELNRMRAETMGESGKKLEIINQLLTNEMRYQERITYIHRKITAALTQKMPRRKCSIYKRLLEKITIKLDRSQHKIHQLEEKKQSLYHNAVMQREALGITVHSWIDEFYMK